MKILKIIDYISSLIVLTIGIILCKFFINSTIIAYIVGILAAVISLALEIDRKKRRG